MRIKLTDYTLYKNNGDILCQLQRSTPKIMLTLKELNKTD